MIYLISSLRNPQTPILAGTLRDAGFEVFDDWFAAGPEADDWWQRYEEQRGHTYGEALKGHAARHVYDYDHFHLNRADGGVLQLPTGKSGHLEIGYLAGQGKPTFTLFDKIPERWDVMYQFTTPCFSTEELIQEMKRRL